MKIAQEALAEMIGCSVEALQKVWGDGPPFIELPVRPALTPLADTEREDAMRKKRTGPWWFHAFFMRRAYEAGYSDAIRDAQAALVRTKKPMRPDLRTLQIEVEKQRTQPHD